MMIALSQLVNWELLELAPRQQRGIDAAHAALAGKARSGGSLWDERWTGDGWGWHHLLSVITPVKK